MYNSLPKGIGLPYNPSFPEHLQFLVTGGEKKGRKKILLKNPLTVTLTVFMKQWTCLHFSLPGKWKRSQQGPNRLFHNSNGWRKSPPHCRSRALPWKVFPFHLFQLRMEEEEGEQELNSALHLLGIVLSQLWQEMVKMSLSFNIYLLHGSTSLSWHRLVT